MVTATAANVGYAYWSTRNRRTYARRHRARASICDGSSSDFSPILATHTGTLIANVVSGPSGSLWRYFMRASFQLGIDAAVLYTERGDL